MVVENNMQRIKHVKVAWLQISAGQGPKECGWVVAQLMRTLLIDAKKHSIIAECVERIAFDKVMRKQNEIEPDGLRSCLIRLEAQELKNDDLNVSSLKEQNVEVYAQSWVGSIKWQGVSPYREKHKRCNWFAAIELVPMFASKSIDLKCLVREVDIETMRSSGPGGQHVNKTSSAVRITHKPTGIQVRAESDRSQHRNRQLAMERLQLILMSGEQDKEYALVRERWLKHYQVKRGSPVRVFHGLEFKEKR